MIAPQEVADIYVILRIDRRPIGHQKSAMKVLLLNGHPDEGSFSDAIVSVYAGAAREAGHFVQAVAIRELKGDPVLRGGFHASRLLEAEIKIQQDLIHWCDHLVIVTPNWWESAPALLKGYIDRVFQPGFAVRYHNRYPYKEPLLRGHSARVIYTGNARWAVGRLFRTDMFWRWIRGCVLRYCGFDPVRRLALYGACDSSEVQRAGFLAEVADLGRRAR